MVMIEAFSKKKAPGLWKHISRQKVAQQLRERVMNPLLINQGKAGLCPSAAVAYSLALVRPVDYVRAVIDLYERGRARIDKWDIEPCGDLRQYRLPVCGQDGCPPPEADWIIMASIRDSEYWFQDYHSVSDQGGAWGNDVARWLRKAGYTTVLEDWHKTAHKDRVVLEAAQNYYDNDYQVCLMIDAAIIDGAPPRHPPRPDHWVVLASDIEITLEAPNPKTVKAAPLPQKFPTGGGLNYAVQFKVFSWGKRIQVHSPLSPGAHAAPNAPVPLNTLLEHFYGYVAAKY
jgi:hypothetical protein